MNNTISTPLLRNENEEDDTSKIEEEMACGCLDPSQPYYRFIIMFLTCFISFGMCFCYDVPAPLQEQLRNDMSISAAQYMAFYSFYSWPNVVLCFFGGYLIDKVFGVRVSCHLFSMFLIIGNLIFSFGALLNSYNVMCLGRFVFGIGGESLTVAQNFYGVSWFKGRELNMVFGLQLSIARLGSTANMNVVLPIYNWINNYYKGHLCLGFTFLITTVTCLISYFFVILLTYFDKKADRVRKVDSCEEEETISIKDILNFPLSLWLLNILCVTYYVAVFTFIGLGVPFFTYKFSESPNSARFLNSMIYIISACSAPMFGFVVDKFGQNLHWLNLSVLFGILSNILLAFTFVNPYISMFFYGLSYSLLAASLWPLVGYIIPEHQLGTAYGLMQAFMNLGLAVLAQVAGAIVDYKGYLLLVVFLLSLLFVALISLALLQFHNSLYNGNLNFSSLQVMQWELSNKKLKKTPPHPFIQPKSLTRLRNRYFCRLRAPNLINRNEYVD